MNEFVQAYTDLEKLLTVSINVKSQAADYVREYHLIEFKLFNKNHFFKAIPRLSRHMKLLTDLPGELLFEVTKNKVNYYSKGKEDVINDLINKLVELDVIEAPGKFCMYDCHACPPQVFAHCSKIQDVSE